MNVIVERIEELRKKKGWSKYDLAKFSGITTNTVYGWTRKDSMPSLSNLELICETMSITLEQFFCGVGNKMAATEENEILQEWFLLSDLEKEAVLKMIETFKILKRK